MGAMLDGTSVGAVLDSMCHAVGFSAGQDSRIRAMLCCAMECRHGHSKQPVQ